MNITPPMSSIVSDNWYGHPLGLFLRTFQDSLGRFRTKQSMLLLADPRGTLVEHGTLDDAIETAKHMAVDRSWKAPALAVMQAADGAFFITPAYHGPDAPNDLDPGPFLGSRVVRRDTARMMVAPWPSPSISTTCARSSNHACCSFRRRSR